MMWQKSLMSIGALALSACATIGADSNGNPQCVNCSPGQFVEVSMAWVELQHAQTAHDIGTKAVDKFQPVQIMSPGGQTVSSGGYGYGMAGPQIYNTMAMDSLSRDYQQRLIDQGGFGNPFPGTGPQQKTAEVEDFRSATCPADRSQVKTQNELMACYALDIETNRQGLIGLVKRSREKNKKSKVAKPEVEKREETKTTTSTAPAAEPAVEETAKAE